MIFEAADGTMAAGHVYVHYVRGKLRAATLRLGSIFASEDEIDDSLVHRPRADAAPAGRRPRPRVRRRGERRQRRRGRRTARAPAAMDALDALGHSAGSHALRGGHDACVARLCAAGAACMLSDFERRAPNAAGPFAGETNYLQQRLRYEGGATAAAAERLVDENDRPVMMRWELALMEAHAAAMQPAGRSVLNVGFGLVWSTAACSRGGRRRTISSSATRTCSPRCCRRLGVEPGVRILQGAGRTCFRRRDLRRDLLGTFGSRSTSSSSSWRCC